MGSISERIQDIIISKVTNTSILLKFMGSMADVSLVFKDAFMYIHPSRGESWGISVLEAMRAGVPTLVSKDTGSKEVVKKIGEYWVDDIENFSIKIDSYYNSTFDYKKQVSINSRDAVQNYTFSNSIEMFKNAFNELLLKL